MYFKLWENVNNGSLKLKTFLFLIIEEHKFLQKKSITDNLFSKIPASTSVTARHVHKVLYKIASFIKVTKLIALKQFEHKESYF